MKAILCTKYGPPEALELKEVEKPAPTPALAGGARDENQALVKVYAASINTLDLWFKGGPSRLYAGFLKPKDPRLGVDIAGRVEAVGAAVTQFKPGDEVFGSASGALAEYACTRASNLALKPANRSFEQAAAVPVAGITALQGLRDKGKVQPGQKVLVNGASGGVGTFAVLIAKMLGAEVTAVCSARSLDVMRSIGADHVIDYSTEDFTKSGQKYDLIFAVNGYHSLSAYRRALTDKGTYLAAGGSMAQVSEALALGRFMSRAEGKKMGFMGIAKINQADLFVLAEALESGKVLPVIDRSYPLSETSKALRYLGEHHARGKIVITVAQDTGL